MAIIKAINIFDDLFKPPILRNGSYFCQVKGIDDEQSYNDFLALLAQKADMPSEQILLLETPIPAPNNRLLIDSILEQLPTMPIGHYKEEDLSLAMSLSFNQIIREAFDILLPFVVVQEKFSSMSIRDNFIVKMMIWVNTYLKDWQVSRVEIPKCVFYGELKKHEGYFLMLLALMGLDVLYLNPRGNGMLESLDREKLAQTIKLRAVEKPLSLQERVGQGVAVERVTTHAKRATDELDEVLYNGTGIFRPWQFAKGTTRAVLMDAVYEDVLTYWSEPARLRTGFKVVGEVVYTPVFFTKILGVHHDQQAYFSFVENLRKNRRHYFLQSPHLSKEPDNPQGVYSLAFCINRDKTINREALQKHALYQRILTFRGETQKFILDKLDEVFAPENQGYFQFPVTDKERVQLLGAVLSVDDALLNLIDGYDFTAEVPKIVIYINNRDTFGREDALLLGLFHTMGMDVLILSPNGANNIELMVTKPYINVIKLEGFVQDLALKSPSEAGKRKTLFQKFFNK